MQDLRKTLLRVSAGQFLEPVIYYGRFFEVETYNGTEWIEQDVIGKVAIPKPSQLADYISCDLSDVYSVRLVDGWAAYASAPGYMDRTDLTVFDTEQGALEYLIDFYSD